MTSAKTVRRAARSPKAKTSRSSILRSFGRPTVVITKMDLADAAGIDLAALRENIRRTAPAATVLELSARSREGLEHWYDFLVQARESQQNT